MLPIRLLLTLLLLILVRSAWAQPTVELTVQLNWKHQFQYAGFYAAITQGYYQQAGLKVHLRECHHPDHSFLPELADGKVQFVVSNSDLIYDALHDESIVLVANYFKRPALVFLTRADIRSPLDLNGRVIAGTKNGALDHTTLEALLRLFNIHADIRYMQPEDQPQALLAGKADAITAFTTNEPQLLAEKNAQYHLLRPELFGIDGLDVNVATSREFALRHPDIVRKFIDATNRGWQYALQNPADVIDQIMLRWNTQHKSRRALEYESLLTQAHILPDLYPIGSLNQKLLEQVAESFVAAGMADSVLPLHKAIWHENWKTTHKGELTLPFCNDPNWPPIDYTTPLGQPDGIAPEFARRLFAQFLPQYKLVHVPTATWQESLQRFSEGECKLLVEAVKTPERTKTMLFTRPYLRYPFLIVTRAGKPYVNGLASLRGKTIARQKGSALIELLRKRYPDINILETDNTQQAFLAVATEQADAALAIGPVAKNMIATAGLNTLVINGVTNLDYPIRIAVAKSEPLLLTQLNEAIVRFPPHELANIQARYTVLTERTWICRQWIAIGVGLASLLLLWFGYRSWRLKKHAEDVEEIAERDMLTGAFNRRGLERRFGHLAALASDDAPLCAMLFDLDHFKAINDTYGHTVGDAVLRKIADIVMDTIRNTDVFVRWGGEEFMILCPGMHLNEAHKFADTLRQRVQNLMRASDLPDVTISIGVAQHKPGESLRDFTQRLDKLLYQAKRNGRNRVESNLD
ncbi:diguanylate cyclase (GGDEF) domain-containing protein [Sulfurivirga caldicuralii]|uniref:diguanylate cyclase n=1 Tax=Sulfurivirga caldicuralii TaxID=364032 RepID=A0A1N6DNC2_9GAMM|nr:transporter substrate-binding domain-containing protein [Sulfurivirga caldicuralii]SIN72163.1 diguanylate cyclase (GGDEF) domain-containing protein [Sulfurivirga caldicuralii]